MKTLLSCFLVVLTLLTASPARAQTQLENMSISELEAQATALHPGALYVLAARLLAEGDGQAAANWMYAGQIRYRFLSRRLRGRSGPVRGALRAGGTTGE